MHVYTGRDSCQQLLSGICHVAPGRIQCRTVSLIIMSSIVFCRAARVRCRHGCNTATLAQPIVEVWGRDYLSVYPMSHEGVFGKTCLVFITFSNSFQQCRKYAWHLKYKNRIFNPDFRHLVFRLSILFFKATERRGIGTQIQKVLNRDNTRLLKMTDRVAQT